MGFAPPNIYENKSELQESIEIIIFLLFTAIILYITTMAVDVVFKAFCIGWIKQ
jgi:hypothetical protein